jgi:chitin synthase
MPSAPPPPSPYGQPSPHANFAPSPQVAAFPGAPDSPNLHYGAAPRRQPRRFKTSKLVEAHMYMTLNNPPFV